MDKFRHICTELWPLIYVKILFPGSILQTWGDYWDISNDYIMITGLSV